MFAHERAARGANVAKADRSSWGLEMRNQFFAVLVSAAAAGIGGPAFGQSGCDGRFIDGIGIPGVNANRSIQASVSWDPDGPGPAEPLLVVSTDGAGAGYSFGGRVFAYDGLAWRPLGLGFGSTSQVVTSLAVFRGELYAAGNFDQGERPGTVLRGLARWDGAAWQPVPGNPSLSGFQTLFVYNGELIAATASAQLTIDGQNAGGAASFDGTAWHRIGQAPVGIRCFGTYGNDLIAGGIFGAYNGTTFNNIARWDGNSWQPMGAPNAGTSGPVMALQEFQGSLFVGGEFNQAGGFGYSGLARWNGSSWSANVGSNFNGFVYSLLERSGVLYAGGSFSTIGGKSLYYIAALDSGGWRRAANGEISTNFNSKVQSLASVGGRIFGAGSFPGVNVAGFGGGFGSIASFSEDPSVPFSPLTSLKGMLLNGFAHLGGSLYAYGILTYDFNNLKSPTVAKLVHGEWQLAGGSLTSDEYFGDGPTFARLRAAVEYQDKLVFAGIFSSVDGVPARAVAAFDGASWSAVVPSALWPAIVSLHSVAVFDGSLILGGEFQGAAAVEGPVSNIARWDGGQLHAMGTIPSRVRIIRNLEGRLYAGTDQDAFQWNGTAWVALRSSANVGLENVNDFILYKGTLIAEADGRAARWDGISWTNLNVGGSSELGGLIEYDGQLFRFGSIGGSNPVSFNIRSWTGTNPWRGVGSVPDYRPTLTGNSMMTLNCAIVHDGELYFGGFVGTPAPGGYTFGSPKGVVVSRFTSDTLPRFDGQPIDQVFTLNREARLQASLVAGVERPSQIIFQWRRNGVPITNGSGGASAGGGTVQGATSATLHIDGVQASDAGEYDVVATGCGSQASAAGDIRIRLIPQDINADGLVNDEDFALFANDYDIMLCAASEMPYSCPSDFNGDGLVDDSDFVLFVPAYETLLAGGN